MDISLWVAFTKRKNSTLQPSATTSVAEYLIDGRVKTPCSIIRPQIAFQRLPGYPDPMDNPAMINYAYISDWQRYYYITDWTFDSGLWIATMEDDPMASWKAFIGRSSAYVERCGGVAEGGTALYYDGEIVDTLYPLKHHYIITETALNAPWHGLDIQDGCFVVGVMSDNLGISAGGMISYWALSADELRQMMHYLMGDTFYTDAGFPPVMTLTQQLSHETAKGLINPLQYIASCMWFPCDSTRLTINTSQAMPIGPWGTSPCLGKPIIGNIGYHEHFTFSPPSHPYANTRGFYLNYPPYTKHFVSLPPFGSFPLDITWVPIGSTVYVYVAVDGVTGKATLQLFSQAPTHGEFGCFFETSSMMGVPIQITQITSDMMGSIQSVLHAGSSLVGAVASGASGNVAGAVVGGIGALSSVGNAVASQMPDVRTQGVPGSFLAFRRLDATQSGITTKFAVPVAEDVSEFGRPLCETRTINTLAGYVKCGDVHLYVPAYPDEIDTIKRFMMDGFFWE